MPLLLVADSLVAAADAQPVEFVVPWWWLVVVTAGCVVAAGVLHRTYAGMRRRGEQIAAVAVAAGCEYSAEDRYGLTDLAFPALLRSDGFDVAHVVSRVLPDGATIRAFDATGYRWVEGAPRTSGPFDDGDRDCAVVVRHKVHGGPNLSGVVFEVPALLPDLSIRPERMAKGAARAFSRDLATESEAFNHLFDVRCRDRRFASLFVDARLIDTMLAIGDDFGLETMSSLVLVWTRTVEPDVLVRLVHLAERMRAQVPRLVLEEYQPPSESERARPIVK